LKSFFPGDLGTFEAVFSLLVNLYCVCFQVFDKNGRFKFQFEGGHGLDGSRLNEPSRIAAFKDSGKLVVADWWEHSTRLQLFSRNGNFIRKIKMGYAFVW